MNHEKTRLYQTSLELVGQCAELIERFPSGLGFLADQLRRASASVPLNFAEGCRKRSQRERERYFETAACSAREVSAIVDVAHRLRGLSDADRAVAKDRCDHLCAMLHRFH
jgi:four helix bundle protein